MPRLTMFVGLPASGKTTEAKRRVLKNPNSIKRVNKDDLRNMIDAGHWSKGNEKFVLQIRDHIIREALTSGRHVISDDTNLHPKHLARLKQIARECEAQFEVNDSFLNVPVKECIKRDLERPNSVGSEVIMGMYNRYLKPDPPEYIPPEDKPKAIICDIDGTLAHMIDGGRSPYEFERVGEDLLDEAVASLIYHMSNSHRIILLSGRDGSCRDKTENWLKRYEIHYDELYMRTPDDQRKDTIIKGELFEEHIRDDYQVTFIVDDRPVMARYWREEMGLKVLQVGDPHVEF